MIALSHVCLTGNASLFEAVLKKNTAFVSVNRYMLFSVARRIPDLLFYNHLDASHDMRFRSLKMS
jgi:hypothetical protein